MSTQSIKTSLRRPIMQFVFALTASLAAAAAMAASAQAIQFDTVGASVTDLSGNATRQAGAHADARFKFTVESRDPEDPGALPTEQPHRLKLELPPGLVGDPTSAPTCPESGLKAGPSGNNALCPVDSQVGVARVISGDPAFPIVVPVYNMERAADSPGTFAFTVLGTIVKLNATVRPSDYGITLDSGTISQGIAINGTDVTLWGIPSDPAHDSDRFKELLQTGFILRPATSSAPRMPFISTPTSCPGTAEVTTAHLDGWSSQGEFTSHALDADFDGVPFITTGCDRLAFDPSADVAPTSRKADAPTGLDFNLEVPQSETSPDGLATAHVKDVKVTLPEGMSISPSAASGLGACSDNQIGIGEEGKANCPNSSKIGKVEIETPVLDNSMTGSVYLGTQESNDPTSGKMFRIFLAASGSGVEIKLEGGVSADPNTGQLTTTFTNNPQLPFSNLKVSFDRGAGAPLSNPSTCGNQQVGIEVTSWSGETRTLSDSFAINQGSDGSGSCATNPAQRPFNPKLASGVVNPVAGSSSPFVFRLTRDDGDQEILSTTVTPPQGVTAKLAGIPYCSEGAVAANNCPAKSRIGTEIAGAGAGSSPFYTSANPGSVYLAGPYKGAPLSMVIQEPVIAGPFDLQDISVRAAIHVNPRTAQLTVVSDPIPQINSGVPLRIRDLRIRMDRPDFTIAPTNCDPMQVGATVQGSHGASASLVNRFQVGDCSTLGFNPRLKLDFGKKRKSTRRNAHPPLHANLSFNEGDSNISSVEVALPKGVLLDQARLGRICSRANYAAETCPAESRVGYAKATTPLLDNPVEGPVYLKSSNNPLPDLAADLNGQIDIDLFGMIDQKENKKGLNQIRNTFDVVPDVPVSHFELILDGGNDGLLVNSRNICKSRRTQKAKIEITGHNGMATSSKPRIGSACKRINKKKAKRLKKKVKQLKRKIRKADGNKKAKKLRKKAKKLKRQAKKLGR